MSFFRSVNLFVLAKCALVNIAVVTAQTSGNPPCYFCDGDSTATLSNPTAIVPIPPELAGGSGLTEISCANLLKAGQTGFISASACVTATATDALKKGCGCSNYVAAPVAAPLAVPAPIPTAPVALPAPLPTTPVAAPLPTTPVAAPVALPPTDAGSPTPTSEPLSPTSEEPTDVTTPTTKKGSMESKDAKKATKPPKEGRDRGAKTPNEPKANKAKKAAKSAPEDKVPKQPEKATSKATVSSLLGIEPPSSTPAPSSLNRN
jgi:hypothetical protein